MEFHNNVYLSQFHNLEGRDTLLELVNAVSQGFFSILESQLLNVY